MAIDWRNEPVIDSVQLPGSETKYWVQDTEAREKIETLANATHFIGVSTTEITDGGTEKPTINEEEVNPVTGDIVIWKPLTGAPLEFIWDGSKWQLLGGQAIENLGDLAYKNSAQASYTPEGTINFTNTSSNVLTSASLQNLTTVVTLSTNDSAGETDNVTVNVDVSLNSETIPTIDDIQHTNVISSVELTGVTNVVTNVSSASYDVVGGLVNGVLPSINNTSTITATMGTGTSSTTLIFSFSDIGFTQGQFPQPTMTSIYGLSEINYYDIGISYRTVSVVADIDTSDIRVATGDSATGTFDLYWTASTIGDLVTQSTSAITGVSATFAGSASTITVS